MNGKVVRLEGGPDDSIALGQVHQGPSLPANSANPLTPGGGRLAPEPLFRAPLDGASFPVDALRGPLADAVNAIADVVQCSPAMAAGSVLAAASLACQAHADVVLPIAEGRPVPLSLFLVTVADSGERKSSSDGMAMRPVWDYEAELQETFVKDRADVLASHEAWKCAKADALKKAKGDRNAAKAALDRLGPEPESPMAPILTVGEPTMQGLQRHFMVGRPSLGLMSDEGGQLLGGWGMSPDNRLATATALNGLWDGKPIKRMRAGLDGAEVLAGRRMALHLMVQSVVAPRLLADSETSGVGLLARCLVTAPPALAGTRLQRPSDPKSGVALATYREILARLLQMPTVTADGDPRHLKPRPLTFSGEALADWREYADACERRLAPGAAWEAVKPWGAKAAEHAARLAGCLTLFHDPGARDIDRASFERGRDLAEYYAGEMLRLSGDAGVSSELREAAALLKWAQANGPTFPLSAAYQYGPTSIRTARQARAACETLKAHGYLSQMSDGLVVDGRRHREAWRLVPTLAD